MGEVVFLLKQNLIWLPVSEFSVSTSRFDHWQKSMHFQRSRNFDHVTELSSVLFADIFVLCYPLEQKDDILMNYNILYKLLLGLPHEIILHIFCWA